MHTLRLQSPLRSLFAVWPGIGRTKVVAAHAAACPTCNGQRLTFSCPKWPACGCPEGAIDPRCPGESVACTCHTRQAAGSC